MNKKNPFLLILPLIFIFLLGTNISFRIQAEEATSSAVTSIENKIKEYQSKLSDLGSQKKSLSSQIQYMDAQIYLTGLKIQETEERVEKIQDEIVTLSSRIDGLDESLGKVSKVLIETVVAGYKEKPVSFLDILLDASNISDLMKKIKYVKVAEENNQKMLIHIQEAKLNFEEQKILREKKKIELDDLEKQLNTQRIQFNTQKEEKQILLTETQSDEKKYQELLAQALAEYSAIQKALVSGSKVGPIKRGEPLALVGNSGAPYCSTGPHLHFEVRKNNAWVNAEEFLTPRTVDNQQDGAGTIGSGSWDWPLSDPIILTQRYGKTPWSWRYNYSGGIHTGIDMVSKSSEVIRAPADGTLYTSSERCGSATINIKYIDHGDGVVSFYLHVQ